MEMSYFQISFICAFSLVYLVSIINSAVNEILAIDAIIPAAIIAISTAAASTTTVITTINITNALLLIVLKVATIETIHQIIAIIFFTLRDILLFTFAVILVNLIPSTKFER